MVKTKIDISPEDRLLKICAQNEISNRAKDKLKELPGNNLNWPYILQESARQGIVCLLYHNLLEFKHKVPEDIWDNFKTAYYANTCRNTMIYQQLNIILSSFNKEDLKVIPLKGVFLAEKVYNNIALRGMFDIDLLVRKKDLPKIDKLLEGLGYRTPVHKELLHHAIKKSYMNSMDYFKADEKIASLHIHWHIVNVTLPTYMYIKNIGMEKFWESAKPTKLAGAETLQLTPQHLVMHLAEHGLKHSFARLILLSDIMQAIKRYRKELDWKELIKEAKESGMERQLFYGLYFTKHFLDADIPDYVLSELEPERFGLLEKQFFYSTINNSRNGKLCYFVYLNMVKGKINKLRFIFRSFFPPPSVLALTFNLAKPRVTAKDYLLFLKKQSFHLKNLLFAKSL